MWNNYLEPFLWKFNGLEKDNVGLQRLWRFWYWTNFHKSRVRKALKNYNIICNILYIAYIIIDIAWWLQEVQNTRQNSIKVTRTTLKQLEQSIEEIQTSVADLIARLMESIVKVSIAPTVWPILYGLTSLKFIQQQNKIWNSEI